jgi:hypothetical protein
MRTADGQIEVISGLQSGELLVIRGAEALVNGVAVRFINSIPDSDPSKKESRSE